MLFLLIVKSFCYLALALLHLLQRLASWHRREALIGLVYLALFAGLALEPVLHGVAPNPLQVSHLHLPWRRGSAPVPLFAALPPGACAMPARPAADGAPAAEPQDQMPGRSPGTRRRAARQADCGLREREGRLWRALD